MAIEAAAVVGGVYNRGLENVCVCVWPPSGPSKGNFANGGLLCGGSLTHIDVPIPALLLPPPPRLQLCSEARVERSPLLWKVRPRPPPSLPSLERSFHRENFAHMAGAQKGNSRYKLDLFGGERLKQRPLHSKYVRIDYIRIVPIPGLAKFCLE